MEKKKIDLYVKGCIITEKYAACHDVESLTGGVAEDDPKYDLLTAIIAEGDMHISSLTVMPGRRVAASGTIFLRGPNPADGHLVGRPPALHRTVHRRKKQKRIIFDFMSGELKSPRPVSSISPHTNKMRHNAQPGANTLCCVVPLFVLPCGEMMQSYKLMYNMKIFEILNFYKETLIRIHECGIRLEDVQYVNLYNDYIDMLAHGDKVSYIVLLLSEKYAVSERKVYSLIKHFQTDCISHAV